MGLMPPPYSVQDMIEVILSGASGAIMHKPCIHSWTHLKWFKPPAWDELSFASGVPTAQPGEGSGSQRAPSSLDWALRFGAS